jgi:hypothetical protein
VKNSGYKYTVDDDDPDEHIGNAFLPKGDAMHYCSESGMHKKISTARENVQAKRSIFSMFT